MDISAPINTHDGHLQGRAADGKVPLASGSKGYAMLEPQRINRKHERRLLSTLEPNVKFLGDVSSSKEGSD